MEMANYYVCCILQFFDYAVADDSADSYLDRVGHQAFSDISKRYAGIYEYFSASGFDKAAEPPDSKRLRSKNFYIHAIVNLPNIRFKLLPTLHIFRKHSCHVNSITNQTFRKYSIKIGMRQDKAFKTYYNKIGGGY